MTDETVNSDQAAAEHHGAVDDWHDHHSDAPPQEVHGETSPMIIALIGLVGFALTVLTIGAIVIYFNQVLRGEVVAKIERTDVAVEYQARRATWEGDLAGYGWIDETGGVVRIPVDRASELVAQEYEQRR